MGNHYNFVNYRPLLFWIHDGYMDRVGFEPTTFAGILPYAV